MKRPRKPLSTAFADTSSATVANLKNKLKHSGNCANATMSCTKKDVLRDGGNWSANARRSADEPAFLPPQIARLLRRAAVHALRAVPADVSNLRRDETGAQQPARLHYHRGLASE